MIDDLMKGLQGQTGSELTKIPGLKPNQLDDIFKISGETVTKEMSSQMMGGNVNTLMNLFSNQKNSSSADMLQGNLEKTLISNITQKLGLDKNTSSAVVSMLLSKIINQITNKNSQTPDNDSSPLESLFGGNKGGAKDIGNLLNKLF